MKNAGVPQSFSCWISKKPVSMNIHFTSSKIEKTGKMIDISSLLDFLCFFTRFDAAGTGACLKRYSDPSLFKIEWARMEIKKAEKEQKDKKNQRIQVKSVAFLIMICFIYLFHGRVKSFIHFVTWPALLHIGNNLLNAVYCM
jgi:hypothetical protein